MNIYDIFIAHVSWGDGGKKRPVLILQQMKKHVIVFNITTQYENKSEAVRSKYFKISDWRQAGLDKQSYVDANNSITLPHTSIDTKNLIGKLTESDIQGFIEFMSRL